MKKLFLLLALIFALSANVSATTVTVSAYSLQNLPFNPTGIGSDRTFTVTTTNGSATVTSSAAFPTNIVGIGGFQILIGSTQYVVASVMSTSSLTLTTNFSGITGSATLTLYKYVLLRAYATAGFQDNVTGQNVQPGTPGSGNFYKQVAVSIINSGSGNVAYLPQFTIPSTTDALINNQARYVFGFYRTDNSLLAFYLCGSIQQLAIQPNTPTTWTAICNFNSPGGIVPPNTEVYTAAQIDQRLPSCAVDQLYFFAASGNIVSCISLGTNLSITNSVLNAAGGGGGGNINPGILNQIAGYAAPGTTLSPYTVGAQLTISGTTLKGSNIRGAYNAVVDYGCVGDGVTNDTACLQNAINAAAASAAKTVYLPGGNYRVTGLTINGPVEVYGDGRKTIISSVTNAPIIAAGQTGGTFYGPNIHDLQITGSVTAGVSQTGITITDATYLYRANLENLYITDTGSHALSTGNVFSSSFTNITLNNSAGYPLYYNSANMPGNRFESIYVELLRASAPTGFYIRQGDFSCYRCNGINNSISGSRWARVGEQNGVDGGTADVSGSLNCDSCNIESFELDGIKAYRSSPVTLRGATGIGGAGTNVNQTAITFLKNAGSFSAFVGKGYIEDTVIVGDGLAVYKNSMPFHSDDTPPIMTNGFGPSDGGGGQIGTYYDDTLLAVMPLPRADGLARKFTVTATTSIPRIGVRDIETNCAAPCTVTIPWGGWYQFASDLLTITDVGSTPTNVTIQADSGGLINGAASYAFSISRQSIILRPDGNTGSGSWRILGGNNQAALTNSQIAYGNTSNVMTSSSKLTWDNSLAIMSLTYPGGNGHILLTDSTNTITVRAGTLSGAPDRGIIGTISSDPFVLYANGSASVGVDPTTLAFIPYASSNTIDLGSSAAYYKSAYVQTSLLLGVSSSTSGLINLRNSAGADTVTITSGAATPEGAITAGPGSQYFRTNGTWYIKASGTGNTGWTLVSAAGGVSSLAGTANQITASAATGAVTLSLAGPHNFATATTNGVAYGNGTGPVLFTAAGGVGTLCLTSVSGAAPVWGACAGSAATAWDALTNPASANLSLSMSTFLTTFSWATGTSTNNLFNLTTANSANGTGYLLNVTTGTSATVKPLNITAAGTANGIEMGATGSLVAKGTGRIEATPPGTTGSIPYNNGAGLFDGAANAILDIASSTIILGTSSSQNGQLQLRNNTNAFTSTIAPSVPAANATFTLPNATATLATIALAETLTNKTLTTPTIGSFTNATHNHTNAAGGGQLTDAALSAAVTVAKGGTGLTSGTSGGIPYFSGATTIASSGALTTNAPVLGGGAGGSPTVGTRSGSTTTFATSSGTLTSGRCAEWDASGNIVQSAGSCAGSSALTATYVGFGNGSNLLTGSANLIWDETNKVLTTTAGSTTFLRLAGGSTATAVAVAYGLSGTGAIHPGSGGGLLMPLVGGSQSSGPGIWWTNNAYNATAGLWISNGLNWQGHSTSGSPFKIRTGTGTSSDGTVRFTFTPDSSLYTQNASTTSTAANVDLETLDLVTTGTAAANLGIGTLYTIENASGSQVSATRIGSRWSVATAASETGAFFVANNNAGGGLGDSFTVQADQYHGTYVAANVTGGATIQFNDGNVQELTLTGNVTSTTLSNLKEGAIYFIIFKQDATGSRTLASTNIKVTGGSLTLTATASARDLFQCAAISTNLYCSKALDVK